MKITAHPLMVAVALGLLGPGALAALEERREGVAMQSAQQTPDADERARAERLWNEARAAHDAERDA